MITVRPEQPDDAAAVRRIHELAFERKLEADLVDRLRASCAEAVALVAEDHGPRERAIIGHVLFTPVLVEREDGRSVAGMGLAPLAVHPDRQRRGVGSRLVETGLEILGERGCPFVVVLGHPEYYSRFGFEPASRHDLVCPWEGIPDAAFMARALDVRAMQGVSGVARYRHEFDGLE